ncbi:MAG: branched-chain amino acid transporter substrate-binding protein [Deltaproteobacteria bacterium]|nr:branched-chain amino acid transporter substrate-binding protein [Deltaproteobacteria bacterium]
MRVGEQVQDDVTENNQKEEGTTMGEKRVKFDVWAMAITMTLLVVISIFFVPDVSKAATANQPDAKIAVVYPLSGALSRNGNLMVQGIKAAIGWVNDNGGIKSLGGAKLVPVIADSGSSVEGAASAMDRVARDPEILMAVGCWASSFTLSATEITERLGIPQFSISFTDALHSRGFKWGFYVSPPSTVFGSLGIGRFLDMAKALGHSPKTAMAVSDNQAASRAHVEACKQYFANAGIKVVGDEAFTMGTLVDATPIMQKVKAANPDIVVFAPSSINEAQLLLMKKRELKINTPFVGSTGAHADPSFLGVGAQFLEGFTTLTNSWPHKLTPPEWIKRTLDQCRKEYSNEAFMGQELTHGWSLIPVMAEALERAGSRNREAIREAALKMEIHDVMATRSFPKQGIAFDPNGRIAKKYQDVLLVQWQDGVPKTIFPTELAVAKPIWYTE